MRFTLYFHMMKQKPKEGGNIIKDNIKEKIVAE